MTEELNSGRLDGEQAIRDALADDQERGDLTRGPWRAKRLATYSEPGWVLLWPDNTKPGTHMRRLDYVGNFTEADARLIAACNPETMRALLAELDRLRSASRQEGDEVPEGCTPADARMLRVANHGLAAENDKLREALAFYAEGNHFIQHQPDAWETVSGEPSNFYEDESNTATVEDGSVAKMALDAVSAPQQSQEAQGDRHGE